MHLIERYATDTGLKIGTPFIYERYIPLPTDKYIIFHPHSKPAKTPDFWQDVLDILIPIFQQKKISIVQIGAKNEKVYGGVINLTGMTNYGQVAYLIRNSEAVLGVDSFSAHFAGYYNKPLVTLYSNNNIANVKPYWGNPDKQILLEPVRPTNTRPNYVLDENPKSINNIQSEKVAKAILKHLGINIDYPYSTIYTGSRYYNRIIEMVPNQIVSQNELNVNSILVRMDFLHNEQILAKQMEQCPVSIITKQPINLNLLFAAKSRIQQIIYYLDDTNDTQFVKFLYEHAFNYILISRQNDNKINQYKLKYMDFGLIIKDEQKKPDSIISKEQLFYKSGKYTLSNGKIYHCKTDWLFNNSCQSFVPVVRPVPNVSEFWNESDSFAILEKA